MLPTAKLVERFAGTATYQIPSKDLVISSLFEEMEARKSEAHILSTLLILCTREQREQREQRLALVCMWVTAEVRPKQKKSLVWPVNWCSNITDWGISQTSLEDVFLNIVRNDEGTSMPSD